MFLGLILLDKIKSLNNKYETSLSGDFFYLLIYIIPTENKINNNRTCNLLSI